MGNNKYYFDQKEAEKIVKFVERLNLPTGKKGQKIKLLPFQKKILTEILATKRIEDNLRRYREAFIFMPRKQGKSFLIACIFVYMLFTDNEQGAQNIVAANSRDQANLLFDVVKNMIQTNPTLAKHCRIVDSRKRILRKSTNSFFQVISSDASRADGYNVHIGCLDETHEAKDDELYTKIKTSMGTRTQPLMITITTASNGQDEYNLEYRTYLYAKKVQSGEVEDDTFYSAIYEADDGCDLMDEEQWYQSNPALGEFRDYDELKRLAIRAKEIPTEEASFRRLYLNQHITLANEQAINPAKWKLCGQGFDSSILKGRDCYCGLDLSTRKDLTAFVMVFPVDGTYYIVSHLFKPAETLLTDEKLDRFPYTTYAKQGYLHATEGDYVNFRYVRQIINELGQDYNIKEIAFDRFGSQGILADLTNDGFLMVDFGQGYRSMSPAISDFYELLFEQKIIHDNNPIMNWMAKNVVATENSTGQVKFDKAKAKFRIDGIIAMLMGLNRAVVNENSNSYDANQAIDDWLSMGDG